VLRFKPLFQFHTKLQRWNFEHTSDTCISISLYFRQKPIEQQTTKKRKHRKPDRTDHRLTYSMLDAVPPIHAESSHVATDKVPSK